MLTVHHLSNSRSQKILWLLEELDTPYELKLYMRDENLSAPQDMKALHPLGTSPLITDQGETFAETGAIIDYILRHYGQGKLQPAADTLAYDRFTEWMHYAEGSGMFPLLLEIFCKMSDDDTRQLTQIARMQAAKHLGYIESALAGTDYLVDNKFTAADIHVSFVGETAGQLMSLADYPNIRGWVARLHDRPAFERAEQKGGYFGAATPP